MIIALRILFVVVLASMLGISVYASCDRALWELPSEIVTDPWFLATLLDAYWGFVVFWLWVAYREGRASSRFGWLVALLLLGNIAIATYMLIRLFQMRPDDPVERLLLRPGTPCK